MRDGRHTYRVGYIAVMFQVLVFVYENYGQGAGALELEQLGRRLHAHGFEDEEIGDALCWLDGLRLATQGLQIERKDDPQLDLAVARALPLDAGVPQSADAMRVYSVSEQEQLGAGGIGLIRFLESTGVLPNRVREIVIDRAMAAPDDQIDLDELKIIVLMVFWSSGIEPEALVLDELCGDSDERTAH